VSWAMMTRDATPIRNNLSMATKNMLIDIRWNAGALLHQAAGLNAEARGNEALFLKSGAEPQAGGATDLGDCSSGASSESSSASSDGASDVEMEVAEASEAESLDLGFPSEP